MQDTTTQSQDVSIGVYPPITRITTYSNAKVISPINVYNNTDNILKLDIVLKVFRTSDAKNGTIQYHTPKDTSTEDAAFLNTVKIEDNNQEIKQIYLYPKESRTLNIVFPGPMQNRDFYFSVIFLHQGAEAKTDVSTISISTGVAGNVLVSKTHTDKNISITSDFQTQHVILSGPAKLSLTLDNNSNSYVALSGSVYIYDLFGHKAGVLPLKPAIVLANTSRIMTGTNIANGKAQDIVWGEKFLLGYYTAKAVINVDKTTTQTYETHFFAVPTLILLLSTIILFVILSIFYRTVKKLNFKES